ncbi:MAG: hypothetical protein Q9218_005996 [Villophora microphyllina]
MHHSTSIVSFLAAITPAFAAPSSLYPLYPRDAASTCDAYAPVVSGPYEVQNDAWGAIPGGSQCVQLGNAASGALSWSTTFNWGGSKDAIKAYPNAQAKTSTPCQPLNAYKTMQSSWSWSFDNENISGDVSYDAFLNPDCDGPGDKHVYEVMVWLAQLGGLNPIGFGTPVASSVPLAGSSWKLYKGKNDATQTTVFSFIADSTIKDFEGDLMEFFNYLTKEQNVDASLKVTSVQAGTEVSVGKGTFTTSKYSVSSS